MDGTGEDTAYSRLSPADRALVDAKVDRELDHDLMMLAGKSGEEGRRQEYRAFYSTPEQLELLHQEQRQLEEEQSRSELRRLRELADKHGFTVAPRPPM